VFDGDQAAIRRWPSGRPSTGLQRRRVHSVRESTVEDPGISSVVKTTRTTDANQHEGEEGDLNDGWKKDDGEGSLCAGNVDIQTRWARSSVVPRAVGRSQNLLFLRRRM
jgi:hypothetical protein